MSRFGPSKYQQYVSELDKLCKESPSADRGRILLVTGSDDYLVNRSAAAIRKAWETDLNCPSESEDANLITRDFLYTRAESRGLFDESSILLLRRIEKKNELETFFSEIPTLRDSATIFILTYVGSSAQAKLKKHIQRLQGHILSCHVPNLRELKTFINGVAKQNSIRLEDSAVRLLEQNIGLNVSKLTNELDKLGLTFADHPKPLAAEDIAPSLGILREDDVFAIDDALLNHRFEVAMSLIHQLLDRGQSPIGINSILARHARNALLVMENAKHCVSPRDFAQATGLHPFVAEKYSRALRKGSTQPYVEFLQQLRKNDEILKTCKQDKELVLCAPLALLAKSNDHKYS